MRSSSMHVFSSLLNCHKWSKKTATSDPRKIRPQTLSREDNNVSSYAQLKKAAVIGHISFTSERIMCHWLNCILKKEILDNNNHLLYYYLNRKPRLHINPQALEIFILIEKEKGILPTTVIIIFSKNTLIHILQIVTFNLFKSSIQRKLTRSKLGLFTLHPTYIIRR
jgi:hypothetical protein